LRPFTRVGFLFEPESIMPPPTTREFFTNKLIIWFVLAVGMVITAVATLYMKSSVELIAEKDFAGHCGEIKTKISERLEDHARILLSGAAFFNASGTVTRDAWRIYTQLQRIENQLPGIQGIGFSLLIPRNELPGHIKNIRSQGFPDYTVRPGGERELYSSIIYLEPFSGRNLRAFGYDMFSEPTRRAAMERARDTNNAALSGKVVLVQETDTDVQAGTLMYVPVYRKGAPVETVEQRRAALFGWVYSPYRMNDLMQGILGDRKPEIEKLLHLKIYDGEQPSSESLLYSCHPDEDVKLFPDAHHTKLVPVDFNGKHWTLRFTQTGGGFSSVEYIRVWITLVSGIIFTLLLFVLIRALQNSRAKALRMVEQRTKELNESERRLTTILDQTYIHLWAFDGSTYTYFNKQWFDFTGQKQAQSLTIETWTSVVHPDDLPQATEVWCQHWETKTEHDNYFRLRRHDGVYRDFYCHALPVWDKHGVFQYFQAFNMDITDRKEAEKELQASSENLHELNDELQATEEMLRNQIDEYEVIQIQLEAAKVAAETANIAKSQFLATMSHEIRTPMNGVLSVIQLLQQDKLTEEQRELTEIAMLSGTKLVALINDILDLAKIEAGKIELEIIDFDLPSMISDTITILALQAREKGLLLTSSQDLDVPSALKGDVGRLRQILINLFGNAIKFTPKGTITLLIQKCSEDAHSTTLGFLIRDSGIGIAADKLEHVFESFTQANGSTTRTFGGTGLGLAICKSLVELMGGTIGVDSRDGEGSTFRFTVVLEKQVAASLPQIPNKEETHREPLIAAGIRILLTEDDPVAKKIIPMLLKSYGYLVDVASDGKDALLALEKNDYELVLMDCMMPEMSGYEVTAVIRDPASAVRRHDIPVIALTGNAMKQDRDYCLSFGMNDHLPKPLLFPDLLAMLEKYLNGR